MPKPEQLINISRDLARSAKRWRTCGRPLVDFGRFRQNVDHTSFVFFFIEHENEGGMVNAMKKKENIRLRKGILY